VRGAFSRLLLAGSIVFLAMPAVSADPSAVVIQAGKKSVTVAELQKRWLQLPAFQRKALGETEAERIQVFVERWILPELLLTQVPANPKNLLNERWQAIEKSVLQQALAERIRKQSDADSPVTDADIKAFIESNQKDLEQPERLRIYRILVATEPEAVALIQKLRGAPDFETWKNTAREKSLDRATNMRGGELGFVAADGKTERVELQVDPALFAAAAKLKDGEIGKLPIREGDKFAVVWRRGHTAELRANPANLAKTVRAHLRESRAAAAFNELVSQLRTKYVKDFNPSRLDGVEFPETPSDQFRAVTPEKRPDH
jgi:peptidyl-prolyl cis-trans isomerase C